MSPSLLISSQSEKEEKKEKKESLKENQSEICLTDILVKLFWYNNGWSKLPCGKFPFSVCFRFSRGVYVIFFLLFSVSGYSFCA